MKYITLMMLGVLASTAALRAQDAGAIFEQNATLAAGFITIDQAVVAALKNNPGFKADSLEIAVQSANLEQARLPDNPELAVESENARFTNGKIGNGVPLSMDLAQSFHPFARLKRSEVAKTEVNIARALFLKQKYDLIAEVKTNFITALALQKIRTLADRLVEISSNAHRASVHQATSGKVSYADTLKTGAESALAQMQRDRTNQNLINAYQELSSLWSSAQVDFYCKGNELDSLPDLPDVAPILERLSASPLNKIAESELENKNAGLALAKVNRIPSVRAGAGVEVYRGTDEISPRASLSLSIPFLNWNQGAIKAALYGVSQAENRRNAVQEQNYKDVLNTYRSAARLHGEIQKIRSSILPQFTESLEASYLAYVSGKTGLLALIDAQQSFFEASLEFIEINREFRFSLIELERITATDGPFPPIKE